MRMKAIIGCVAAALLLGAPVSSYAGKSEKSAKSLKARTSQLGDEMVYSAVEHGCLPGMTAGSCPGTPGYSNDSYAGAVATAYGDIKGIGHASVMVSSSWDWGLYSADHRGALMNTAPHVFPTGLNFPDPLLSPLGFTADATVVITAKNGDQIFADIVGGSVYELYWIDAGGMRHPPGTVSPVGTVNEATTHFQITGGTGRFASITGSGVVHTTYDSLAMQFEINEITMRFQK